MRRSIPTKIYVKNIFQQNFEKFFIDFNENFEIKKIEEDFKTPGTLTGYYEPAIKAYNYPKEGSYPIYKHPNTVIDQLIGL